MSPSMPPATHWSTAPIEPLDLGEGPHWDQRRAVLSLVDINAGALHELDPATGSRRVLHVGQPLGAAVARRGGGYVLAMRDGVAVVEADALRAWNASAAEPSAAEPSAVEWIAPGVIPATHRFNDAKCDAHGRLWAGATALEYGSAPGNLYRIEPDGQAHTALEGVEFCNGMGWSPDGQTFYFIDSAVAVLWAFDFDVEAGGLSGRREHIRFDPALGTPDGMTVDAEGGIWVALYGAGAVERYDGAGVLTQRLELPARQPTCPGFGGEGLRDLYITTAAQFLDDAGVHDGTTLVTSPDVPGLPAYQFAG